MATSLDPETSKNIERRRRCFVGQLPQEFLRVDGLENSRVRMEEQNANLTPQQIQEKMDEQAAFALHHQLNLVPNASAFHTPMPTANANIRGRLLISVMQAKLQKNYGLTRMDPYVRIHIGHNIYETPTDVNGAKNPRWNKTIQCFLPHGIHQIYLEIYDECSFSVDELIAHSYIQIPEEIFKGETSEEWYNLSGKHGDGKEGQILLVFSFMSTPGITYVPHGVVIPHNVPAPNTLNRKEPLVYQSSTNVTDAVPDAVEPQSQRPPFNEEEFKQLKEMFPNMDEDVVKSVYEAQGYNRDSAAAALIDMTCE